MSLDPNAQAAADLEWAIQNARHLLEQARDFRATHGLDREDAAAFLESRLCAQKIAKVQERVRTEVEYARHDPVPRSQATGAHSQARRRRQMI